MASLCGKASEYFLLILDTGFLQCSAYAIRTRNESFTKKVSRDNCTSAVEMFPRGKRCVFSAMRRGLGKGREILD